MRHSILAGTFAPSSGTAERYAGTVRKFGVDANALIGGRKAK